MSRRRSLRKRTIPASLPLLRHRCIGSTTQYPITVHHPAPRCPHGLHIQPNNPPLPLCSRRSPLLHPHTIRPPPHPPQTPRPPLPMPITHLLPRLMPHLLRPLARPTHLLLLTTNLPTPHARARHHRRRQTHLPTMQPRLRQIRRLQQARLPVRIQHVLCVSRGPGRSRVRPLLPAF